MYFIIGGGIALFLTVVLASFFGFGMRTGGSRGDALALAFRAIVELVLVAGFIGALIATAALNTTPAWQLLGAYTGVRFVALVLEALSSR